MHLTPEQLIDHLEGAGDPGAAAHVRSCEMCREQLSGLQSAIPAAAACEVPDPPPVFWHQLSWRVHEAVAAEGSAERQWRSLPPLRVSWSRAALAGVAAAVALAVYSTVPRPLTVPGRPAPAAITLPGGVEPSAAVLQPFGVADDPSLALVADLAGEADPDALTRAGWTNHAGGVDEVVTTLTDEERLELQRLLQEALEKRDAS